MSHYRARHHRPCGPHRPHSKGPGVIRRVTQAIADHFGFDRGWVLAGFIVGLIINFPLTIGVFLVAWVWTDNPHKLESFWENLKDPFLHMKSRRAQSAGGYSEPPHHNNSGSADTPEPSFEADPFMDELKRKFEDLEKRAGKMERHVTSDDYELKQKFKRMEDEK